MKAPPDTPSAGLRAAVAMRAALALLVPLARWLVHNGVTYASFAPALKSVFIEAARRELAESGGKQTDSALSVLSGVQRRDIRQLDDDALLAAQPKTPSIASQVFTRWLTDAALRGRGHEPIALPKTGAAPSFDALAREMSSDVHPRTLLAEMERLGLVRVDGDSVHLQAQAFVPQRGFEEMVDIFAANASDHLAAAAHNLRGDGDRFLEQSVFASGLSARSTQALAALARRLWRPAFQQMAREATRHYQQDQRAGDAPMRMRFGVYYYAEPLRDRAPDPPAHAPVLAQRRKTAARKR
ncbi:MAG: hypothetical protein KIT60_18920 [Burkholderiaceae bacterium]|nr:hypothetical protein [Burkholderiaceae bacterium]